jgi:hypothetical protein
MAGGSIEMAADHAPPSSARGIELAEPPPKLESRPLETADDLSGKRAAVGLEPAPATKARRVKIEPPAKPSVEPPAARSSRKPEDSGLDLDRLLAEHRRWIDSGGAQGHRLRLDATDLSGRDLAETLFTNATLRRCDFSGSDCAGAQFSGADLRGAEFIGAKLTGCNMAVARLRHAKLRGGHLDSVNLKGADLAGADLTGADFGDADVTGANLLGADLSEADLSQVSGLMQAQLESVIVDNGTRLPPGIFARPPSDGD